MDIESLQSFIRFPEAADSPGKEATVIKPLVTGMAEKKTHKSQSTIFVSEPPKRNEVGNEIPSLYTERHAPLLVEAKQIKNTNKQSSSNQQFLGLSILLVGVLLGAFVMKQIVDSFGKGPMPIGEAREIGSLNSPVSSTTHTAEMSFTPPDVAINTTAYLVKKDSVAEKSKLPGKSFVVPIHKIDTGEKNAPSKLPENDPVATQGNQTTTSIKQVKSEEEKSGSEEIKKQISSQASLVVSANDYKVGLFGGISGLQVSVMNSTSVNIENAIVEVEFLKPNGSVVKTELISIPKISAGGSKTVAVPSSSRGVKVRCRIVGSNAREEIVATDNM
jgi:hypothetical protein